MFLTAVGSKGFDQSRFQLASTGREVASGAAAPQLSAPAAAPSLLPPSPETAVDPVQRVLELVRTSPGEAAKFGLSAAGGLLLTLLGLRALFSGGGEAKPARSSPPARTRAAARRPAVTRVPARATSRWFDDEDDEDEDDDDDDDDDDD
jgi:hypothetical protein